MNKKTYERVEIDVVTLESEDVITTSGETPPEFNPPNPWELPYTP